MISLDRLALESQKQMQNFHVNSANIENVDSKDDKVDAEKKSTRTKSEIALEYLDPENFATADASTPSQSIFNTGLRGELERKVNTIFSTIAQTSSQLNHLQYEAKAANS